MLNAMLGLIDAPSVLCRMRAVLAVLFLTTGCSFVAFPGLSPDAPLRITGRIFRPAGRGPFPAVALLHSCHGVSASNLEWARWFSHEGYVALVVDSWGPRWMTEDCTPTSPDLAPAARLDDALGALRYLQTDSSVDPRRIGALGWSNGGAYAIGVINGPSLARARARGVSVPEPGFAAAVGIYPGTCRAFTPELVIRPLLVLIGDADDWTLPKYCTEMVESMRARGADASIVLYPGAYHYFDVEGQPHAVLADVENQNKPNACCGATVAYDTAAAADARRRVREFFGYHLKAR